MDYQFIHSVARGAYVDVPTSRPVPNAYLTELRKYAGAGDGLESELGGVYSYFTYRMSGGPPVTFFNHIERKRNARYPCNFIQSAGWLAGGDMLLKNFDAILTQKFFTEDQVDGFLESGEVPPVIESDGRTLPAVSIHGEAMRAILFGCLLYWLTGTAPVRIAVPQSEPACYNEYVLGAVREIYSYFPANMRSAIGFCSYLLPAHAANYRRFGLIFVPQEAADARTIFLDGSKLSACEAIPRTTGLESLDLVADHLLSLEDPEQRRRYLDSVYQTVEADADQARTFLPVMYSCLGDSLRILKAEGSVQELIPVWIAFAEDRHKYPALDVEEIELRIDKALNGAELKRYADHALSAQPSPEEILALETSLLRLGAGHGDCTESVWEDLSERLQRCVGRPEDVYQALLRQRTKLSDLVGQEKVEEEISAWALRTAKERTDREIAALGTLPGQFSKPQELRNALDARVNAFPETIKPYVSGDTLNELCAQVRDEADRLMLYRLRQLVRQIPLSDELSDAEIKSELKKLQYIETMLPGTRDSDSLRSEIQTARERLSEIFTSRDIQLKELLDYINSEPRYFAALQAAAKKSSTFSPEKVEQLRMALRKRRPKSCIGYAREFKDTFNLSVTACARSEEQGFFPSVVREDMASYFDEAEEIKLSHKDTKNLLKELDFLKRLADSFGHRGALKVSLDGQEAEDADTVAQVCELKQTSKSLTAGKFLTISDRLLEKGCYRKEQRSKLLNMASSLGADPKSLVRRVLEGKIPDMSKADYRAFFEELYQVLPERGISGLESKQWICSQAERVRQLDPEAEKAIKALRAEIDEEIRKKTRRRKILIISAVAAGVLILAAGVFFALRAFGVLGSGRNTDSHEELISQAVEAGRETGMLDLSNNGLSSQIADSGDGSTDDLQIVARYYQDPSDAAGSYGDRPMTALTVSELERRGMGFLSTLDLSGNADLTNLSALCGLEGIRLLKLDHDTQLKPEALRALSGLSSLEYLSLREIPEINEELAAQIAENNNAACVIQWTENEQECVHMDGTTRRLDDPSWVLPNASALTRLLPIKNDLQTLRALSLPGAKLTADDLALLLGLNGLEMLDLTNAGLRDETIDALFTRDDLNMPDSLRILVLAGNPELSGMAVDRLKTLVPGSCYITLTGADTALPDDIVLIAGKVYPRDTTVIDLRGYAVSAEDLECISGMSGLRTLKLADTGITELPELSNLAALEELDLSGCGLTAIPDLGNLTLLSRIDLSRNPIGTGGLSFSADSPISLNLSGCGLSSLPFDTLPANLRVLNLSGNKLASADLHALNDSSLRELNLSDCGLNALPADVLPASLEILDLSGNSLSSLHAGEELPANLVGLSLANNGQAISLNGLDMLSGLSWLDLSAVDWSLGDNEAAGADLDGILRTVPSLKVLIVSGEETEECGQIGDCLILPFYYSSKDIRAIADVAPPPEDFDTDAPEENTEEDTDENTDESADEHSDNGGGESADENAEEEPD